MSTPDALRWTGPTVDSVTIYPSETGLHVALATHGRKRLQRERALAALASAVREAVDRHA